MPDRLSIFAIAGAETITTFERTDSILSWLLKLANGNGALVALGDRGVPTIFLHRGEMMGFQTRVKEEGLLDDGPRLLVIVDDDVTRHFDLIVQANEQRIATYILPMVK